MFIAHTPAVSKVCGRIIPPSQQQSGIIFPFLDKDKPTGGISFPHGSSQMDWFKETLAKWIDETGLSKEDAAKKLGVGRKSISNYLNPDDKTIPNYLTAFALIHETGGNIQRALPTYDPDGDTPNHARATIERLQHRVEFLETKLFNHFVEGATDEMLDHLIADRITQRDSALARKLNADYQTPEHTGSGIAAEESDPPPNRKPPS
jgi:predicted DNA-binding protein (UPF0251 family)